MTKRRKKPKLVTKIIENENLNVCVEIWLLNVQ